MPDVTVVVLFSREAAFAERCLGAIARALAAGTALDVELVLVLNAVGEETRAAVRRLAPDARLVASPVNTGTNAGWNLALANARGRFVALLHEDSEPEPGWLDPLVHALDADPRAAVAGSLLLDADGTPAELGAVVWDDGLNTPVSPQSVPEAFGRSTPLPVFSVPSASLLLDHAVWAQLGGFDERFFPAMFTEHDFCTSVWRSGRTVLAVPGSAVRHAHRAMVRPDRGALGGVRFREFLWRRAAERFRAKWPDELAGFGRLPGGVDAPSAGPGEHAAALARIAARAAAPAAPRPPVAPDRSLTAPDGAAATAVDAQVQRRLDAAQRAVEREFAGWLLARLEDAEEGLRWHAANHAETLAWLASREARIADLQDRLAGRDAAAG